MFKDNEKGIRLAKVFWKISKKVKQIKDGRCELERQKNKRRSSATDENTKKPFENHKTTETSVFWTCEKAKRVPQDDTWGKDGGKETERQATDNLGWQCGELDGQKQAGVYEGSSGSESVECHITSTSRDEMTLPDIQVGNQA